MKRFLATLAFLTLLIPAPSFAITQWVSGSDVGGTTQTGTSYAALTGTTGSDFSGSEVYWQSVVPIAGTFSNLSVEVQSAPGAGNSVAFTVRKNNTDTSSTCTIADANTSCQDATGSFTVVAGDAVNLKAVTAGSPGGKRPYTSIKFVGSNAGESFVLAASDTDSSGSNLTTYANLYGARQNTGGNLVTSTVQTLQPTPGTYSGMYVRLSDSSDPPGTGNTHVFTLQVNNVDQFSCGMSNSQRTCSNTTGTVAVVAGDKVNWKVTGVSSPARSFYGIGLRFVPTTDGESVVFGSTNSNSGNGKFWQTLGGSVFAYNWQTDGAAASAGSASTTYKNMYINLTTAPGGSATRTFNFANDDATSTLGCVITGTDTSCFNTTSSMNGIILQRLSLIMVNAGTPAASRVGYGYVQYTPEAGATSTPAVARRRQPLIVWIDE